MTYSFPYLAAGLIVPVVVVSVWIYRRFTRMPEPQLRTLAGRIRTEDFTHEELALLHGAVLGELERRQAERMQMRDGRMLSQTYRHAARLDALRAKLEERLQNGPT